MNSTSKEIEQMLKTFDPSVEEAEIESPSTEVTEELSTEAPSTDEPDEFYTEGPSTDEPSTESPSTEIPEEDERDKEIAELRAKLAEKEATEKKAPSTEAPISISEQDFIGDIDIDEVTQDPKEFNKLLNKIYQQAVEDTGKQISNKFSKSIPDMVKDNLTTMTALQKASEQFYKENKDLEPFGKVVSVVFEELAEKDPNESYEKIMKNVATESRKRLGLDGKSKQQGKEKDNNNFKVPRLPKKKGKPGRGEEAKKSDPLQSELEEMNKTLRR